MSDSIDGWTDERCNDGWTDERCNQIAVSTNTERILLVALKRRNATIAELRASNARLIEALRPFAEEHEHPSAAGAASVYAYENAARVLREETKP